MWWNRDREDDWERELRSDLELEAAEQRRRGLSENDARRAAHKAFGNSARLRESMRESSPWMVFERLRQDLYYAIRVLWKSPGFTLAAVLSLALGIGANTAIFSLIDSVVLSMLPVSHPEQLVAVWTKGVQVGRLQVSIAISNAAFRQMQEHATTVSGLCSSRQMEKLNLTWNGQADLVSGEFVSGSYFPVLGVPALLGRTLGAADDHPEGRVAVLTFGYWQRRYGSNPGVIGRPISVNNVPFTIVGVAPRDFYGTSLGSAEAILMPAATLPQVEAGKLSAVGPKPADVPGDVIARLKPGIPASRAAAELSTIFRQAELANASEERDRESIRKSWVELVPAGQGVSRLRNNFSEPLKVLMAVTGLVMLIACANIANLLLAKGQARRKEIAIRLSLGSSRWRLMRQLLAESLLLSFLGGLLGILFAVWARGAIIALSGSNAVLPSGWNVRVFAFTAGACILSALLFGTAPAWRATRVDFAEALKTARAGRSARNLPLGRILVAAQVSLSLVLLVGAGLFLQTLLNLNRVDVGYDRDHSLLITIDPSLAGYHGPAVKEVYRQILERAERVPGVQSASLMQERLMTGRALISSLFVPGYVLRPGEDFAQLWVMSNEVGAGFFKTSGMRLVQGRDFTEKDNAGANPVAIINQTMARHFFGDRNPIGRQVSQGRNETPMTVVGVMRDVKVMGVRDEEQDLMFIPFLQSKSEGSATLLVRTIGDPLQIAPAIRASIQSIDSKIPQFEVRTMGQQVEATLSQPRLLAILVTLFGILALGLAAIGLYGVLSYGVAQRTGEIGVRMALGARPANILRLILLETAWLLVAGVVAGSCLALAGRRVVASMLYGAATSNYWMILAAVAVLSTVALIAGFLPARRASRVEPMAALRE